MEDDKPHQTVVLSCFRASYHQVQDQVAIRKPLQHTLSTIKYQQSLQGSAAVTEDYVQLKLKHDLGGNQFLLDSYGEERGYCGNKFDKGSKEKGIDMPLQTSDNR